MALRWPWWSTVIVLAAVLLPGATSARSAPPDVATALTAQGAPTAFPILEVRELLGASPRVPAFEALPVSLTTPDLPTASTPNSTLFDRTQVVSLYGYPEIPAMGDLGRYSPAEAAMEVARMARGYDALNGERGAVGAIHLIVAVAQPVPGTDGSYLNRLDHETIATYVEAARAHEVLLILDTQCGMVDVVDEARHLEAFLAEPFVHLALDPEFAMRASGGVPGQVIGSVDASDVNAVQRYLGGLVSAHDLPAKMLIIHQFRADMLTHSEPWQDNDEVLLTINVDGWGDIGTKLETYEEFALAAYAEHPAIKLFDGHDVPLMTPEQVLALPREPDLVVYQ